jgi:hypothetical protein
MRSYWGLCGKPACTQKQKAKFTMKGLRGGFIHDAQRNLSNEPSSVILLSVSICASVGFVSLCIAFYLLVSEENTT